MKILFTADIHIKLGQKDVPVDWQRNRYLMLAQELKELYIKHQCDLMIIGGDIFDTNKPTSKEVDLNTRFFSTLKDCNIILYTGNHEMLSKKESALSNFTSTYLEISDTFYVADDCYRSADFDIIDYTELKAKTWKPAKSKLCFTHVRGEIPPHVTPEIDLQKFVDHGYELVIAGDLHSFQNSQHIGSVPLMYPGSPLSTSFARSEPKNTHGVFIIDTDTLSVDWVSTDHLPQLITKTISVGEEMVAGTYHHLMYEIEGNILELKSVENSELLKKKLNNSVSTEAKLQLKDKTVGEELDTLWQEVYGLDTKTRVRLHKRLGDYKIV
ncbi:exonuclease subunit 1 [Providencia phage vB_PreS_PR1]|uniref:Exonuclease subunit 1 n=1 Tax=Providencia phage vB_PreS_PR1 TaxID=1931407 RepID=A0A1S6KUX9_9CAUD|nr:exonuclease subunit 1 [Providencia phage vB_PreS_PR1]AQT25225.1 exonuclease subunit 1 [Providencia phage vB_PreS_PR1]